MRQRETAAAGDIVSHIDEYYFLTDPEELVVNLLTLNTKWQLLKTPYTLEKFSYIPHLKPDYFRYNLEIKSSFTCRYHATDGKCHLSIQAKDEKWEGILEYKLYFKHVESKGSIPDDLQLDKYVIMERSVNQLWKFIIRFPVTGVYKLEIYGGQSPGIISLVCEFKLFCDSTMEYVRQLPCDPGLIGFGPTPKLESIGLTSPSQPGGIILIRRHEEVSITFILKRKVSVRSELVHTEMKTEVLQQYISQKSVNKKLQLNVNVPEIGEYALRMYAKNKQTNREENVCNYLLSSDDLRKKKRTREVRVLYKYINMRTDE